MILFPVKYEHCYDEHIIKKHTHNHNNLHDEVLICRSSDSIVFFKKVKLENSYVTKSSKFKWQWQQYHVIKSTGFVYYTRGNKRFQLTDEHLIKFYLMDQETLMPKLENVMTNYARCSQMMFASDVRLCITYQQGQSGFGLY